MRRLLLFLLVISSEVRAEPWLGARFARNCQGCHEPERLQRAAIDRRCSLSCQGCHVNPNGGGLRSQYGKWTEDHWLKTFNMRREPPTSEDFVPKVPPGSPRTDEMTKNQKAYKYHLSKNDPWRQMAASKWDGGVDARWFSGMSVTSKNGEITRKSAHFPMALNLGVRYRPFYRHLHLVYESQIVNSPAPKSHVADYFSRSKSKSLYVMIEDMPWNTFVMAGIYKPLFGNVDPYHYSLTQQMTSVALKNSRSAYDFNYPAVSVGTAPNVPYANFHLIGSRVGSQDESSGVAGNLGFRGVRYGQSLNYSFWISADKQNQTYIQMHALGVFLNKTPWTLSYEATALARREGSDRRQGGVQAFDLYLQTWRNIYLQAGFQSANVTTELKSGNSAQLRFGLRSFLFPGFEFGLHWELFRQRDFFEIEDMIKQSLQLNVHSFY